MENMMTIGKAAQLLGCNKSMLRYYESEFKMDIPRTSSNRRMYSEKEIEAFRYINRLKQEGRTNTQIKAVLHSQRIEKFSYREEDGDNGLPRAQTQEGELVEVRAAQEENMQALFAVIAELRDEINAIKGMGNFQDKDELLSENARLKAKLKEKTYELVETREKLSQATKAPRRGLFK